MKVHKVRLKQTQPKLAAEEWQRVVHAAAHRQCRTVHVRLMDRAAQSYKTSLPVNEGCDLRRRIAEDQAELPFGRSVIVPVGMIGIFNLATDVTVEEVIEAPDR